MTGVS